MRELKFRAWNKKRKKIYRVSDLHIATILNGGLWATVIGKDIIEDKEIKIQIQPEDITVMQYTGLKDKKGNDIYEGDILINNSGQLTEVSWSDEFACFCNKDSMGESIKSLNRLYYLDNLKGSKIVGNIYENPELIKKAVK